MKDKKYRVIVWDHKTGEPLVHLNKIVKSYATVLKMRNKYKNLEVHSWPVDNTGKPKN